MSIDHCRNLALESGKSIFGQRVRYEEVFWESELSSGSYWKTYYKCLVADKKDDMLNAGESDTCDMQHYVGSETAISFFRALDPPANHVYPFEGLRTMNDAKAFCASQGGPGTLFGLDDNDAQTEGV